MSMYLAFDLGASNGRGILGGFDGERLSLEILHRFENRPIELHGHYFWNILGLYENLKHCLLQASQESAQPVASIGIDTWGCDFALLDKQGKLVSNPYAYRDPQTRGIFDIIFNRIPRQEIFHATGLQFIEPNSLAQLFAMKRNQDPVLKAAETFLMIPDLLHYWLTGQVACEYTDASTSQLMNIYSRSWDSNMIRLLDIPETWFPTIVPPGTILGPLRAGLVTEVNLNQAQVIATATHDTAAAVAAVPVQKQNYAYISSGTWALLGMEIAKPLVTPACMAYNFTNEGGVYGKIRLLKNIANLWFLQESRYQWSLRGEDLTWDELASMAREATPFIAFIDPDDPEFLLPGDLPGRIQRFCQGSGQVVPQTKGEILRVVLESLAYKYRFVLECCQALTGCPVEALHIVGGGARNQLLNQFAANTANLPVLAGPSEATAIGNILMQMVALGELGSLEQARELVRDSFEVDEYLPEQVQAWEDHYPRFLAVTGLSA